jgi:hypothetical protein
MGRKMTWYHANLAQRTRLLDTLICQWQRWVERILELKTLQPAPDQQELPTILQNMGRSMDNFARNIAVDGLSVKIAESKFSPPPFLSRLRASKLTGQQALLDTVDPLLPLPSRGYAQAGVLEEFPDSRLWSASRNYN